MTPPYRCSAKSGYLSARKYSLSPAGRTQAVPRHQEETYRQALENVSPGYVLTTILMMPPPKRSSTSGPVKPAKYLDGSSGNPAKPAMLEKLMQTRVRNLLAQPAARQRKLNLHLHLHLHRKLILRSRAARRITMLKVLLLFVLLMRGSWLAR